MANFECSAIMMRSNSGASSERPKENTAACNGTSAVCFPWGRWEGGSEIDSTSTEQASRHPLPEAWSPREHARIAFGLIEQRT